ncbi:Aste57867_17385 [Aphanomyces stellatus]|uniref:Aste57867_17385 protein n=1 Tax=Aphanomyces stellatus TaxID=120398 RepID=A0A485L9F1_9STRA|nr:hypothetical protein As57867_017325 [Aphanomyces stellatus]VFT94141.1 Aste57867_17385 [Aphanomyces stellatus]
MLAASRPMSPPGVEMTGMAKRMRWQSSPDLSMDEVDLDAADATPSVSDDDEDDDESDNASVVAAAPPRDTENIRAVVRIKPATNNERTCVEVDGPSISISSTVIKAEKKTFSLDGILSESAAQADVFDAVGRPLVAAVLEGYNGTIFAYGQTGSGKTHTMLGGAGDDRGVIPRMLEQIFRQLDDEQHIDFTCTCSYLEIYNEKIFDLLDERTAAALSDPKLLREDALHGVFVQDLLELQVRSPDEALDLLVGGSRRRTVGSTAMNHESSRSHSVFTIKLVQRVVDRGIDVTRKSTLHLVDLAGSEKQSQTGAVGTRLKEAAQINKSLSVLGNVITALVDLSSGTKKRHVHYRDSKLTFLLRDALGGNSKTTVVATVAPTERWALETISTLQFVQRVKCIKNNVKKYEDERAVIARLEARVRELEVQLDGPSQRRRTGSNDSQTQHHHATELAQAKETNEKLELVVNLLNQRVNTAQDELLKTQKELSDTKMALAHATKECESLRVNQTLLELKVNHHRHTTSHVPSSHAIAPVERTEGETPDDTIEKLQHIVAELHSQLIAAENARELAEAKASKHKPTPSLFGRLFKTKSKAQTKGKWWQRWRQPTTMSAIEACPDTAARLPPPSQADGGGFHTGYGVTIFTYKHQVESGARNKLALRSRSSSHIHTWPPSSKMESRSSNSSLPSPVADSSPRSLKHVPSSPNILSPVGKTRKLFSPTGSPSSSQRHLPRTPSAEKVTASNIPRPGSSKVASLKQQFELKIDTARSPRATVAASPAVSPAVPETTTTMTSASFSDETSSVLSCEHAGDENIRALVRIRPTLKGHTREESDPSAEYVKPRRCVEPSPTDDSIVVFNQGTLEKRQFSVDALLPEIATQDDVFKAVGMRVVDNTIEGYNGSIFAYGQTGSGKTHTMQGDMTDGSVERGVIPRILEYLFETLAQNETSFDMTCSYLEIYNEKIFDLLDASAEPKSIREDPLVGVFVQDLVEQPVHTPREALAVLVLGGKNRTVGSTAMNRESSRSHSVFAIQLTQRVDEGGVEITRKSTLHLIDLAGSEKQSQTGAVGTRLKEAAQINKSLSVLGNVITALVDVSNGATKRHVPYRESKLTFLLRDALGGNSKTTLVATVAAEDKWASETLSTLQFMQRAKHIKNTAKKNEDTHMVIQKLQADLVGVRAEMEAAHASFNQERDQLRMENEHVASALVAARDQVRALEAQVAATADQDAAIRDQATELAHAHSELDECQNLLRQLRLDFKRASQTQAADAAEATTLRDEMARRDQQQTEWQAKLSALEGDLAAARGQLAAERREADALRQSVAQLKDAVTTPASVCDSIAEDDNVPSGYSPTKSMSRRSQHRHSESDLSEEFRQALGEFNIPASIEEAHRDLQLQHDQLQHIMQKLDALRNSKKFLQHALQTTLHDNSEMVQSLRKLQVERNTAMDALQKSIHEQKKVDKKVEEKKKDVVESVGCDSPTLSQLKRGTSSSFRGFNTLQKDDEMKQLAAERATLTARLKTTQAKVQSLEDELKKLRLGLPTTSLTNAEASTWAQAYTRVAQALMAVAVRENDMQTKPWTGELDQTEFIDSLVETVGGRLKEMTSTVDNQKLTIQILEMEVHCLKLSKETKDP